MKNRLVQIIILNYNSYNDTIKLVRNLDHQQYINFGITVVDNSSTDNSIFHLTQAFLGRADIDLIVSKVNGGYAQGNNLGLKSLLADSPKFVVILNNDVVIENNHLLYQLVQTHTNLANPGLIAPVQVNEKGEIYHHSAWKYPGYFHDLLSSFWIYRKFSQFNLYSYKGNNPIIKVDLLPGSFLFGTYEFFKQIDFFDENTFLYLEERILFAKARIFGFQNYLITNLNYFHQSSSTIDKEIIWKRKYDILHESLIYFTLNYRRYGSSKARILKYFLVYKMAEIKLLKKFSALLSIRKIPFSFTSGK